MSVTTPSTTTTTTSTTKRRLRIPFRPKNTFVVKQDLSKNNSSQNIVPKVPKITKYDKSIDDTYHYLVTIETTTESSRENFENG